MKKILPIIFLTIISAFLIFYRFSEIPKNLTFDEVEFTKLALSLNNKPYIPYSQLATGHSTLYFYVLLTSLKTFGINTFALRFPAAIFGILSVVIFYFILKIIYQKNILYRQGIALSLPIILLTSRWFLNFTRFSFEATFLLFLELMSIYFLLKFDEFSKAKSPGFLANRQGPPWGCGGLKNSESSFYLIISGLFAGLAFLSYTPGRIFFLLPVMYLFLTIKQWNNVTIKQFLLFLIPFIIIITPLTTYLMSNKDIRVDQQFFLKNNEVTINEKIGGLWSNISKTSLMFNFKGDVNGRHNYPNKPALNPIMGILFLIGLITATTNYVLRTTNYFFLFYFLISLFPALMTYPWENPNMLRTFTALPSIVYFVGNAIYNLVAIATRLSLNKKIAKYLIFSTFYLILTVSCVYELRSYFKYQSIVFDQAFEIKLPLEKAIKAKLKP